MERSIDRDLRDRDPSDVDAHARDPREPPRHGMESADSFGRKLPTGPSPCHPTLAAHARDEQWLEAIEADVVGPCRLPSASRSTPLTDAEIDERKERIARAILNFWKEVERVVEDVPDSELPAIAKACRDHDPGGATEEWAMAARRIDGEAGFRSRLRRADAMNLDCYCMACAGECRGHDG